MSAHDMSDSPENFDAAAQSEEERTSADAGQADPPASADADPPISHDPDPLAPEVVAEPAEVVELRETVSRLEARLRTVSAAYRSQQEEIQAIRARLERQAATDAERRRGEVVATLFEPTQNLRRSIKALTDAGISDEYVSGLSMTLQQIMDGFHKLGLEEVPGKGAKFDPNLHEAIAMVPVTDPALDSVVLDVFSTGYRIGNRLIAPARVIIGQRQESVGEA